MALRLERAGEPIEILELESGDDLGPAEAAARDLDLERRGVAEGDRIRGEAERHLRRILRSRDRGEERSEAEGESGEPPHQSFSTLAFLRA